MKLLSTVSAIVLLSHLLYAQIALGEWRDHLPYTQGQDVAVSENYIYCATGDAMFSYSKADGSIERISKVNGLSDIGISTIEYSYDNQVLVVGYSNGNLDLIFGKTITNISDIKRKNITGSKAVNSVLFVGDKAFLSCGFGIVVVDLGRKEIHETFYIGDNATKIEVYGLAILNNVIYAATINGIYYADAANSNLANYANWTHLEGIPNSVGPFTSIATHNQNIYFSYSGETSQSDVLYKFDGTICTNADTVAHQIFSITSSEGNLVYAFHSNDLYWKIDYLRVIDAAGTTSLYQYTDSDCRSAEFDKEGRLWIADNTFGLVKRTNTNFYTTYSPNGPKSSSVVDMTAFGGVVHSAAGGRQITWNNLWKRGEVNTFQNESWSSFYAQSTDSLFDVVTVVIDPQNSSRWFAGGWYGGLFEFVDNTIVSVFRHYNSPLQTVVSGKPNIKVSDLVFDADHNLWVVNSVVDNLFNVQTNEGEWKTMNYGEQLGYPLIDEMIITNDNIKWLTVPEGGLIAFDENGTLDNMEDDQLKSFDLYDQHGEFITRDVYSIAEDKDGYIWVGTNQGVLVYYNPENVFTGENFNSQKIIVEVGGSAQYLLETEIVTDIEIDGANRKWFSTQNAGVFLMSEDGTEQLLNFNEDNSPLLSNTVNCIAIDGLSGEVFFGTSNGIVSYKGDATDGKTTNDDIYVYPNPVRESYDGIITIVNLVANSNVKITSISGNLVYETTAEGGTAKWDGRNFDGYRVQTGVYLIFCTNEDGSETFVSKILFIN